MYDLNSNMLRGSKFDPTNSVLIELHCFTEIFNKELKNILTISRQLVFSPGSRLNATQNIRFYRRLPQSLCANPLLRAENPANIQNNLC